MPVVVAAVLKKNGKMLIAQRRQGDSFGGKWELPGGKLERDESFEECIIREMREEFGVAVSVNEFISSTQYDYTYVHVEILVYSVSSDAEVFSMHAHDALAWVTPREFPQYDFLEADKPLLDEIAERYGSLA